MRAKGFRAVIERENCVVYEVAVIDLRSEAAAARLARRVRAAGFGVTIEQS